MGELYTVWSFIARHKIWLVLILIVLMVGFVDENSYWQRRKRQHRMDELRAEIAEKRKQYERDSLAYAKLETDRDEVVRVAREVYFMGKDNEDIYVLKADEPIDTASVVSEEAPL